MESSSPTHEALRRIGPETPARGYMSADEMFIHAFNHLAALVHDNARRKGFWDPSPQTEADLDLIQQLVMRPSNGLEIHEAWSRLCLQLSDRNDGEMIALLHSEASELLEGLRHQNPPSDHIPSFSLAEEECADLVIRLMDMAYARRWRVAEALIAKILFNAGRPLKHGKQF